LARSRRTDRSRWVVLATLAGVVAIRALSIASGAIGVEL